MTIESMATATEAWMPEARKISEDCWRDETTKHILLDPALVESVAIRIAVWMDCAAEYARNAEYWRNQVEKGS